jgi:hypothetical protein
MLEAKIVAAQIFAAVRIVNCPNQQQKFKFPKDGPGPGRFWPLHQTVRFVSERDERTN